MDTKIHMCIYDYILRNLQRGNHSYLIYLKNVMMRIRNLKHGNRTLLMLILVCDFISILYFINFIISAKTSKSRQTSDIIRFSGLSVCMYV